MLCRVNKTLLRPRDKVVVMDKNKFYRTNRGSPAHAPRASFCSDLGFLISDFFRPSVIRPSAFHHGATLRVTLRVLTGDLTGQMIKIPRVYRGPYGFTGKMTPGGVLPPIRPYSSYSSYTSSRVEIAPISSAVTLGARPLTPVHSSLFKAIQPKKTKCPAVPPGCSSAIARSHTGW
jgi:hypothetical protein